MIFYHNLLNRIDRIFNAFYCLFFLWILILLIFCFLPFQDFEIRRTDENKDQQQHDFLQYDDPATAAENSKNHMSSFLCVLKSVQS